MAKTLILFCLLFCNNILLFSATLEENRWNDYQGKIDNASIQMALYPISNNEIIGNYYYIKEGIKIELKGTYQDSIVDLIEYVNGKVNGFFHGVVCEREHKDLFEGTWTNSTKIKSLHFKLSLSDIIGGDPDKRYWSVTGTDVEVEKFTAKIKSAILKKDKTWIADNVCLPIRVTINKKRVTIKSKKSLRDNFDRIFYPEFIKKIEKAYTYNLFCRDEGVMLGNGEIWINSISDKPKYCISSINN